MIKGFIYGIWKGRQEMANAKIIEQKGQVVSEIKEKFENENKMMI